MFGQYQYKVEFSPSEIKEKESCTEMGRKRRSSPMSTQENQSKKPKSVGWESIDNESLLVFNKSQPSSKKVKLIKKA